MVNTLFFAPHTFTRKHIEKNLFRYLGMAGVVNFGGLRIGGISGIFKRKDFCQGHWEAPPFNDSSLRSIYHVREYDVWKLAQVFAHSHTCFAEDEKYPPLYLFQILKI